MKNKDWEKLETIIKNAYESSVTIEEAERHAARFLGAQMDAANRLKDADLDARMRRAGLKAKKANVYLDAVAGADKKPSDVMIGNIVDTDEEVIAEQKAFDIAEVERDYIQNYFNVFKEAHIHFRSIAKGRFE